MNINLMEMPFTRKGSYMALSKLPKDWRETGNKEGFYLRTVHGSAMEPLVAMVRPLADGEEAEFESCLNNAELVLKMDGRNINVCFDDADTILIQGDKGTGLCLDFLTGSGPYDYIYEIPYQDQILYMANCYKNNCRYLVWAQTGEILLEQQWEESTSLDSCLNVVGEDGFLLVLREIETEWDKQIKEYSYEDSKRNTDEELLAFYRAMPECAFTLGEERKLRYSLEEVTFLASYLNWGSIVRKDGFLTRDAMFMSKNWMCNVWSWDHCFNAVALSYHQPELAWDQFMIMFDAQDLTGRIPDSINDAHVVWNYCKPPIHGWALRKMMEHMELSDRQKAEAYSCLGKWTSWWLNYRTDERTGLCVYDHGNDSGWDNSTVFSVLPPVASPELQAYLVIQMELLSDLAMTLGKHEESEKWRQRSGVLMERFLEHCFQDRLPLAMQTATGKTVNNNSLLPFESLILGRRLPRDIRVAMAEVLKGGKFLTQFGFATESPESNCYREDGYWRGPIWAPSTMLLLDGLSQCGEKEFVRSVAGKFAQMVSDSGFAENFNALTGQGLRDRAYTWTSSAFLVMAHEYL